MKGANLQILQISTAELLVGNNLDLSITNLLDLDNIAQVAGAAVDLDLVLEELLKRRNVKDLVRRWLRRVDDELLGDLGLLALGGFLHKDIPVSLLYHAAATTCPCAHLISRSLSAGE